MGSDLYWLSRDKMEGAFPRYESLLKEIRDLLRADDEKKWSAVIADIEQELWDAGIH